MRHHFPGCERLFARNFRRGVYRQRLPDLGGNSAGGDGTKRSRGLRDEATGEGEHQKRRDGGGEVAREHSRDLPQVLRASGGVRKLSEWQRDRGAQKENRRGAGEKNGRFSRERSCHPQIPAIATFGESSLKELSTPGSARRSGRGPSLRTLANGDGRLSRGR